MTTIVNEEITITNNINKYDEGICFEKKEKTRNIGVKNQNKFFLIKIPSEREYKAIIPKIAAWWSMSGVPIEGYASTATAKE